MDSRARFVPRRSYLYVHCTVNNIIYIWRRTPGDKADVPTTELLLKYRVFPLLFQLQSSRLRLQKITLQKYARQPFYRERQLWSGNKSVNIRYESGSFVAGTSASSPGVSRHVPGQNKEKEGKIKTHLLFLMKENIFLNIEERYFMIFPLKP